MQNEINVRVGDNFAIKLEGYPTSGYRWEIITKIPHSHIIRLVDTYSNIDNSLVGAPADENFVFRALSIGSLNIVFRYRRPWEKDTYLEERKFNIKILD
ncbi:MAG: protease inhibitor I42 family protein [Candidatus Thorarchaeota archaeon]